MNEYSQEILKILLQMPEGLPARKISRHVYNAVNSFFCHYDYDEVHKDVLAILQRWDKDESSYVERTEKKGYYRIRKEQKNSCELMFNFIDEPEPEEPQHPSDTGELSLF